MTTERAELLDPERGDHMTIDAFNRSCEDGMLTDDDGFGEFATATHVFPDTNVSPSDDPDEFDPKYTHVVWYNK